MILTRVLSNSGHIFYDYCIIGMYSRSRHNNKIMALYYAMDLTRIEKNEHYLVLQKKKKKMYIREFINIYPLRLLFFKQYYTILYYYYYYYYVFISKKQTNHKCVPT
jgi:hypothetical protein